MIDIKLLMSTIIHSPQDVKDVMEVLATSFLVSELSGNKDDNVASIVSIVSDTAGLCDVIQAHCEKNNITPGLAIVRLLMIISGIMKMMDAAMEDKGKVGMKDEGDAFSRAITEAILKATGANGNDE